MNNIQNLIDRELGLHCRFNYDTVLKRLVVNSEESFYGLQSSNVVANFEQDPPIFACRFAETSGYEHILALANEDGKVAIQDTSTQKTASRLEAFQCHNNAVFDLAWMPKNMNFITVSGDHTACLWDAAEGSPKRVLVFSSHTKSVKIAVFRPMEPSVFATGARDGHILIWDIRACNQPTLVLKPDNCLMNCHSNFAPKTPSSHGKRPRIDGHRAVSITGLVFQDDDTLLSCGECDGNIKAWDLRKNYNVYKREPLPKHSIPYCGSSARNGYSNLVIDHSGVRLYASCMDDVIYCFNLAAYNPLPERRYVGHHNGTFYVKSGLSADGAYLVSGSSDKYAYLWNVKWSEPLLRLSGHRAEVTCAALCRRARGPLLVTAGDDARHLLWRLHAAPRAAPRPRRSTPRRAPPSAATTRPRAPSAASPTSCPTTPSRLRSDPGLTQPAVAKRPHNSEPEPPIPSKYPRIEETTSTWGEAAESRGLTTPTKNYEKRSYKTRSPKSPKPISPSSVCRSPVKASPTKIKILTFTTPTKNLPNFVLNGEAPHLRLMSPAKKKPGTTDWLTKLREQKEKVEPGEGAPVPLSPREPPPRRNSGAERTPKSAKRSRTILTYFTSVAKNK
ncbi:LOW QUALITY PROTEIN: protein lethal(2)denticleless [Bombyx mandarina]|uniref:LOW QUALITY PROTEIN: protein lethal(2)denticleless n=1 Tax=Bombyx mandarina TaxID=7092 RepID=A0A6J2KIQ8_BOMMA|nr:LOW QUALITY PROTEIN: protein lethal(2)denticleless [Bombyx mandarina]